MLQGAFISGLLALGVAGIIANRPKTKWYHHALAFTAGAAIHLLTVFLCPTFFQ